MTLGHFKLLHWALVMSKNWRREELCMFILTAGEKNGACKFNKEIIKGIIVMGRIPWFSP